MEQLHLNIVRISTEKVNSTQESIKKAGIRSVPGSLQGDKIQK